MDHRTAVTVYHNPMCSKSRQTLDLLREQGVDPDIVPYLEQPPDEATLRRLLSMLNMRPADLLRRQEPAFRDLDLASKLDDDDALIAAMIAHPVLMERPIVVHGERARIGRPPEAVNEIL